MSCAMTVLSVQKKNVSQNNRQVIEHKKSEIGAPE